MNAREWTPNLHAHVVFDWTQPNGKSVRLSRDDMAELQTIASETLGMERGVSSDRRHLSAVQYKTERAREQLQELSKDTYFHAYNRCEDIMHCSAHHTSVTFCGKLYN